MLSRSQVGALLRDRVTIDHDVSILSPYSFRIRPQGFDPGEAAYSVVVDRSAFHMIARVVPDYMAIGVRAAISSGVSSNPSRLEHLRLAIESLGWQPEFDLGPSGIDIGAFERAPSSVLDDVLPTAVAVAALLSEFVLDQMIVTRSVGEVRPAVPRNIGTEEPVGGSVWDYDPSARDRATQQHRALENWLIATLEEIGIQPLDAAGEPFFDLAWRSAGALVVCEVKTTSNSEVPQVRLGLGQVLHYASQLRHIEPRLRPVLLIEQRPVDGTLLTACSEAGVTIFWPEAWDSVRGEIARP